MARKVVWVSDLTENDIDERNAAKVPSPIPVLGAVRWCWTLTQVRSTISRPKVSSRLVGGVSRRWLDSHTRRDASRSRGCSQGASQQSSAGNDLRTYASDLGIRPASQAVAFLAFQRMNRPPLMSKVAPVI